MFRFRELADMLGDLLDAKEKDYIKVLGERYASDRRMTGDILQWMASPDYQVKLIGHGLPYTLFLKTKLSARHVFLGTRNS